VGGAKALSQLPTLAKILQRDFPLGKTTRALFAPGSFTVKPLYRVDIAGWYHRGEQKASGRRWIDHGV
jgi:hypothetical protein